MQLANQTYGLKNSINWYLHHYCGVKLEAGVPEIPFNGYELSPQLAAFHGIQDG
jgi:hypothetical protein